MKPFPLVLVFSILGQTTAFSEQKKRLEVHCAYSYELDGKNHDGPLVNLGVITESQTDLRGMILNSDLLKIGLNVVYINASTVGVPKGYFSLDTCVSRDPNPDPNLACYYDS
ncbi:MAG: hypothetical protein AB7O96_07370 [Pseudobdellovibrionaceae bacterium]